MDIFQTQPVAQISIEQQTEVSEKPNLTVRVRSMRQMNFTEEPQELQYDEVIPDQNRLTVNSIDPNAGIENTYVIDPEYKHSEAQKKNAYLETQQVAQTLQIPEVGHVQVEKPVDDSEVAALVQQQTNNPDERAFIEQTAPEVEAVGSTATAQFNASLPFPTKPTIPNKLVGMILTPSNDLIPGAIVEIKTSDGHVSRAVKSNALGQFFITTPLDNGEYIVDVEKDGYEFSPLTISLKGKVVDPIEVRSAWGLLAARYKSQYHT